jgi:hypothetical protein
MQNPIGYEIDEPDAIDAYHGAYSPALFLLVIAGLLAMCALAGHRCWSWIVGH